MTSLPKIVHDASTRKGVFKASEKVQTRSRNTLSHISNSVKPNLQKNHSMKLKVMAEEPLCPSAIAEEGSYTIIKNASKHRTRPWTWINF